MSDNQNQSGQESKNSSGKLIAYPIYFRAILRVLQDEGGSSNKDDVIKRVNREEQAIKEKLIKPIVEQTGYSLVRVGLIDSSEKKMWKLTKEGDRPLVKTPDDDQCFEIKKINKAMIEARPNLFDPILEFLRDLSVVGASQDKIIRHMGGDFRVKFNLSDDRLRITDKQGRTRIISSEFHGDSKFQNLVIAACRDLRAEGAIKEEGGVWRITKKGVDTLLKIASEKLEETASSRSTSSSPRDLALTYKAILKAARDGQYVTDKDIENAHGRGPFGQGIGSHLDRFMRECFKKSLPILGVMVVADDVAKESGVLTSSALEGTIRGAREAGYHEAHLLRTNYQAEQEKVFKWAKTETAEWDTKDAPDNSHPNPAEVAEREYDFYTVQNIMDEGCFLGEEEIEKILTRWKKGKNLILQGPPGTGKTWLAKRLGKALIGSEDSSRIRVVQFHPSTSYEDFVLGYRPAEGGKLELVEGVFLEMVRDAKGKEKEKEPFILVIEEINRGRPAQIFGELLTLIENTKRNRASAMQLAYHGKVKDKYLGKDVYVPENLYIIGTMNLADRSLAMVDMALRRRFAFHNLESLFIDAGKKPSLRESGARWKEWCIEKGLKGVIDEVERIMPLINKIIKEEPHLGEQFYVGHSYFTPGENESFTPEKKGHSAREWVQATVENNLRPLLAEYAVRNPEELEKLLEQLEKAGEGEGEDDSSDE